VTRYVQVLVAPPVTPAKMIRALADMARHGMPADADLGHRDLGDGLELRARW
jgi:hypothetical protein